MITVSQALDALFSLAPTLPEETVPLTEAAGRVLAQSVFATRDQPPFPASAMDGYAVSSAVVGQSFRVIGEAAAGHGFNRPLAEGEAVRIFTGAPVPSGAGRVLLQEDMERNGDTVTLVADPGSNDNIRPAGTDFRNGMSLTAPRRLTANDIALLASMNIGRVPVTRKPEVAIISTGDELVAPGESPGPDQIIASNTYGLHALLSQHGATPRLLPLARDTEASLTQAFSLAQGADLILTIGGASVGDHDLVAGLTQKLGMEQAFHKVAMRPGKPLMSGRIGASMMIGLPGNPVSAMVCGHVFVLPVVRAMLGLGAHPAPRLTARLSEDLPQNGPREHYMRGVYRHGQVSVFDRQDSSLLTVLAQANALIVRPPRAPASTPGSAVDVILI